MKLLRSIQSIAEFEKGVVATIGNFDGVHLGHQNLIKTLKEKANKMHIPLVVVLFEPQPREYFHLDNAPARLSSLREKLDILKTFGVDFVYCIRFNKTLAQTTAADFARHYLFATLNTIYLLVGEDFCFGTNREGNAAMLKSMSTQYSCQVETYSDYLIEHEKVSSTRIRSALQQGNLQQAAQFLGRNYSLCGRVIRGAGRGRCWGIPTANVNLRRLPLPLTGVYVVQVHFAKREVWGVANIGKRPTVDGTKSVLEVHLLDFNDSIYGNILKVFFLHKLRNEVKFTSVDALISQIHQDIAAARAFLTFNDFAE
jgi:riboflavin kinase/FMN adenylyltransferase